MTPSSWKKPAIAGMAMFVLAIAAVPASASYLGYGNGDPGDWDLWTEQAGGPDKLKAMQMRERADAQRHRAHNHVNTYRRGYETMPIRSAGEKY